MKNLKMIGATAVLMVAALLSTSCTPAQTTTVTLDAINIACSAALIGVPVLESNGVVDSATGDVIVGYATTVSAAVSKATTEAESTDTTAVKYDVIVADFANAVVPNLPANISPSAAAIVKGIQTVVSQFLQTMKAPATVKLVRAPENQKVKVPMVEKMRLHRVRATAKKNVSRGEKLIKNPRALYLLNSTVAPTK